MDVGSMFWGSLIAGGVSLVFGLIQFYGFQRREQVRDKEVDDLRTEVKTLRDGKISEIERRLDKETLGRKTIHDQIDGFGQRFQTRDECERHHRLDREQRVQEIVRIEKSLDRQTAEIGDLSNSVSALAAQVKLLVDDKIRRTEDPS